MWPSGRNRRGHGIGVAEWTDGGVREACCSGCLIVFRLYLVAIVVVVVVVVCS